MKFSAIALGLMFTVGAALAQKPETGQTNTRSANAAATEKTGNASEVKTQTYKGTLVDAACGGNASSANREKASAQPAASTGKSEAAKGDANRSANAGSSCSISSSSGEFALQTKDGRTLHFDAVGNERVKQELLNRKNWASASSAGKPIQATVNGTETGNSLLVLSIH